MISFMGHVYIDILMVIWVWLISFGCAYELVDISTVYSTQFKKYRLLFLTHRETFTDMWWTVAIGSFIWPMIVAIYVSYYIDTYIVKTEEKKNEETNSNM